MSACEARTFWLHPSLEVPNSRHLRRLAEYGMLQHLGNGVYVISQRGEDDLAGNLDADGIDEPNGNGEKA